MRKKTYREADLSAQRHSAAMCQQTTLRANPVPPANIASKREHVSMAPASTFRLEQAQSPIRAKSGNTGFVVDLGTFRSADAAKRALDQMQRQFRKKGMDLWLYITPVKVDGRARLRLHSDGIGLGMTKKTMRPRLVTAAGLCPDTAVMTASLISILLGDYWVIIE